MPTIPRLNGVIKALEEGKTAFVGFAPVDIESAAALASAPYDGIAFEMEHAPMSAPDPGGWDVGPQGDSSGADSSQRRRDESVGRQAGA
jgi:hypothetical protein